MTKGILTIACWSIFSAVLFTQCKNDPPKPKEPQAGMQVPLKPAEAAVIAPVIDATKPDVNGKPGRADNTIPGVPTGKTIATQVPLTVIVDNLESPDAPVEMSIFGPTNKFLNEEDHLKKVRFTPINGKLVAKVDGLNYGELGIALYQDINDNGKIDKNVIGLPKEPYAFSNNFKVKLKAPSFRDCEFKYDASANTVHISLPSK